MYCNFLNNVGAIKQKKLPKWKISPDMVLQCGENMLKLDFSRHSTL